MIGNLMGGLGLIAYGFWLRTVDNVIAYTPKTIGRYSSSHNRFWRFNRNPHVWISEGYFCRFSFLFYSLLNMYRHEYIPPIAEPCHYAIKPRNKIGDIKPKRKCK